MYCTNLSYVSCLMVCSPFIGDGDGAVDAAAEADVVEGVDQLGEDEHVEVAALRRRPRPHCRCRCRCSLGFRNFVSKFLI